MSPSMEPAAPLTRRRLTIRRLVLGTALVALVVAALTTGATDKFSAAVMYLRSTGPAVFFLAMALLPLVGVPLMPFTFMAGPTFGPTLGIGWVIFWAIAAVGANVALSYGLAARIFRSSIAGLAAFFGYQIPTLSGSWHIAAMVRLAPGLPFFVQSYMLGVMRVPFGSYMMVSVLVQAGYISGVVLLGDALWQGEGRAMFFAVSLLVLAGTVLHFLRRKKFATAEPIPSTTSASIAPRPRP